MLRFLTDLFKPEAAKPAPSTSETSMNFDLAEVPPFLTGLANNPRFGLPEALVTQIADNLSDLPVDQSSRWQIEGSFDGKPALIEIQAFMDDFDAPDLAFFGSAEVVAEIDRELIAFDQAREG